MTILSVLWYYISEVTQMIAIIDYGAGNLRSVEKALEFLGFKAKISAEPAEILAADKIILPGVGAFGVCMDSIRAAGLDGCIREAIHNGKPFLGICLGLQLLFDSSEESPGSRGLSIFKGGNKKIPSAPGLKIPHMGWNSIAYDESCPIFRGLGKEPYMYFVHSYHIAPEDESAVCATTCYGAEIPVAVWRGNIFATQFHPEKSGDNGLKILKNFGSL